MPPYAPGALRRVCSRAAIFLGAGCLAFASSLFVLSRGLFDPVDFGDRMAASLADPRVAAFAGDRITRAVLEQSPDLTPVRPLLLATAQGLAGAESFRGVVRTAARSAHRAAFAEGTRRVVLSVPDVGVLLASALERASPELAERIPEGLEAFVAALDPEAGVHGVVIDLWQLRTNSRADVLFFAGLGLALLAAGWVLAGDRYRALVEVGAGLLGAGLLIGAGLPLGGLVAGQLSPDALTANALAGLWYAFMGGLASWALLFIGLGVVFAAAGASLLESFEPLPWLERSLRRALTAPSSRRGRLVWGIALLAGGGAAAAAPSRTAAALGLALGIALAFLGVRELFRLLLESVEADTRQAEDGDDTAGALRAAVVVALTVLLGGGWLLLRNPAAEPAPTSVTGCNGSHALCDRAIDQVSFAGAHNAMSHTEIPDWLFPHHQASIPNQLRDGVRALLIDVHYGLPGASRIKTDLDGRRPNAEALEHALGPDGIAAALRIRDTLVGADQGRRGLYLCHGFCEIGAYELEPTLGQIRRFLLQQPGSVLILVIEDYVAPEHLAAAFEASGLADRVYRGPSGPPWPTLRQLVASGQNALVFLESGTPGVPWLRPAFEQIQETPYTFHAPEEFSCRAHRGGTAGSLFQLNHWIETTPTPLPSNAEIVNARPVLLDRARRCAAERDLRPNVLAVDFYRSGDLLSVVEELNRGG